MRNTQKLQTKDKELVPDWYVAKRIIRAKGYTYNQLAKKLGVSVTTIHDICNFPPNVIRIKQLADAIGCSFFDFFNFGTEAVIPSDVSESPLVCPNCGQPFRLTPVNS